jgi:hypothetical protein
MGRAETARYVNYPICNSSAAEGVGVDSTDDPDSLATFMKWTTLIVGQPRLIADEEGRAERVAVGCDS